MSMMGVICRIQEMAVTVALRMRVWTAKKGGFEALGLECRWPSADE